MKKLTNLLAKIPVDKYMHFLAGMIISTIFVFLVPTAFYWCAAPAIFAGFAKYIYDKYDYGLFDIKDVLATGLGGMTIQIFSWLNLILY